ncbi:type VI secretion system-associated FHA domain protein [Vibrio maritimus]
MQLNQLNLFISKCPEEYTGSKHIEIPENGGSIGRAPSCALSLSDHNRFISGTHCLVSVYGDTFYISDVSTNGTLVNGNKLLKSQPISLCDGDVVSLGQYEITVSLENTVSGQDIAIDIAPERTSSDPLINLDDIVIEEEHQLGAVEELFMETKPDDVDNDDPIAHIEFSTKTDDDFLIRDKQVDNKQPEKETINTRQLADDSISIHSQVDLPNLIPEDWLAAEEEMLAVSSHTENAEFDNQTENALGHVNQNQREPDKLSSSDSSAKPNQQSLPSQPPQTQSSQTANSLKWEEVTQHFVPANQASNPDESNEASSGFVSSDSTENSTTQQPQNICKAFYEGLGVTDPELMDHDASTFKHLGAGLRLCMEHLQNSLKEIEALKDEVKSDSDEVNLTELMLTLTHQDLLSPNELVEQMLDELSDHRILFNKAVSELLIEQTKANDPLSFAKQYSNNALFSSKSKLWSSYQDFYQENSRQIHEGSLKELLKENYNKVNKGKHA